MSISTLYMDGFFVRVFGRVTTPVWLFPDTITTPAAGLPRRSAQTAMYWIAEAMQRWLAPILSFTAEEINRNTPGERPESVFFTTWADIPICPQAAADIDWARVLRARAAVLRELEALRVAEKIGAPLDAEVDLYCDPEVKAALDALGDELRFVLITSDARVHPAGDRPADAKPVEAEGVSGLWLSAHPSAAAKCVRCWHKRPEVGRLADHPELCGRCVENLEGGGETRRFA